MPNLILGSTTVITENAGTATIDATLTNASNMPKGVSQGIGYLLRFHTADNTATGFVPGGTGERVITWTESTNGLSENTTWVNPILTLNTSGHFTMAIGYYDYKVCIPSIHQWQHWGLAGVRKYGTVVNGVSTGSGLGDVTQTETAFGQTFGYANNGSYSGDNDNLITPGVLKVTSTAQKYVFTFNNQSSSYHQSYLPTDTVTAKVIQAWASFLKIG